MAKNIRLASIYVKIHNKKTLTVDDLAFLAIFDPECFRKTCENLVYNLPETEVLMEERKDDKRIEKDTQSEANIEADRRNAEQQIEKSEISDNLPDVEFVKATPPEKSMFVSQTSLEQEKVEALLDNLKKLEWEGDVIKKIDVERVKNLLGNLYMEMLFPHDDRFKFFCLEDHIDSSIFNRKV